MLNHKTFLKNNSGFLRYLKNTSWLMGEKVLRMIVALTIGVWVTRYLGPQDFGIFSYAQSYVAIFLSFSSLGINDLLARELVTDPKKENVLMGTSFALQTVGSILVMICLLTSIWINPSEPLTNKIIIVLGLTTFIKSFGVLDTYFTSKVASRSTVLPMTLSLIISTVFKIIFILIEAPLIYFVYLLSFDIIFIATGQIYLYQKSGGSLVNWKFSKMQAKMLLRDSWPLVLSGIVISIYMRVDQIMIKELLDNAAVGNYAAAVRLSEAWYFIPSIICASLFPAIINAKMKNEELYKDRLQRLFDLMLVLGLSIVLPVTLLSNWIILFLYGPEFNETASVLSLHIWAGVFVFFGVANQKWFISENLQTYNIICLAFGMVANILLNLWLIPIYGIKGAAFATLVSQFIASVLAPVLFRKTRPSFWRMMRSLFFISLFERVTQK